MVFLIEVIVVIALFTLIVITSAVKNPLAWIDDYPPAIAKRVREMGLVKDNKKEGKKKFIIQKLVRSIVVALIFSLIMVFVNNARTFLQGFLTSYILWIIVDWYDALILDCIFVCHLKVFRFPGTEDLDKEYKNYWFHIKMSLIGMVIGLFISLIIGGLTALISLFL